MSNIEQQLAELSQTTLEKLKEIQHQGEKELQDLRVAVLGKKGSLTDLLKGLKDLSNDMKPIVGKQVNEVRDVLTALEETAQKVAAAKIQQQLASETIDVTLPGCQVKVGKTSCLDPDF